jgi:hypothetical protein
MSTIILTPKQRQDIETQYQRCLDETDDAGNARGEHWILLHLLNRCSISASGPAEAMQIAERLVINGL